MFDFHEKRKIRSFLYSRPVAFGLLFFALLLGISVYDRLQVVREIQAKIDVREAELARLEERAQVLASKVEYLENDRGIEEEIRNRFDVARSGEQVVVLIDDARETKSEESTTSRESLDGDRQHTESGFSEKKKSILDLFKFW